MLAEKDVDNSTANGEGGSTNASQVIVNSTLLNGKGDNAHAGQSIDNSAGCTL